MERWLTTLDTKETAAYATLGATVKIQSSIIERTSQRIVRFLVSHTTEDGLYQIGRIRRALRDKTLPQTAPTHPVLTILRAFMNRESRLAMMKDGKKFRLIQVPRAPGVWQYVPADTGLPGLAGVPAIVRTQDARICDALVTAGFPILAITGSGRHHEFSLAAFPPLGGSGLNAAQLIEDWRADAAAIPFALPFAQACRGLHIREQLLTEVFRSIDSILISKPRSTAHAVIRADAAPVAWDKATKFFTGIK